MNYHDIKYDNMLNGQGLRAVLFVSGCNHNCEGCHNPETHDSNSGLPFTDNELNEILEYLENDYVSGLTLSGGDPLYYKNRLEIKRIIKAVRDKFGYSKNIWLYTGYTFNELKDAIDTISMVDVLVDGKYIKSQACGEDYPWVGSFNQRLIDIKKTLEIKSIVLYEDTFTKFAGVIPDQLFNIQ